MPPEYPAATDPVTAEKKVSARILPPLQARGVITLARSLGLPYARRSACASLLQWVACPPAAATVLVVFQDESAQGYCPKGTPLHSSVPRGLEWPPRSGQWAHRGP